MPGALGFVGPPMAFVILVTLWLVWQGGPLGVGLVASHLALPLFFLGSSLLTTQELLGPRPPRATRGLVVSPISGRDQAPRLGTSWRAPAGGPDASVITLPVFLGLGVACIGCAVGLAIALTRVDDPRRLSTPLAIAIASGGASFLLVATTHASRITRRIYTFGQEQAVLAVQAQLDADRARMAALQAQMNPHFLFNALNTVASLLATDAPRAERTIENLSSVLERTLSRSTEALSTLNDELRFVREYLDIERERFGDRLAVTFDVDPAAALMRVPTMSLQPLVENAIKHALVERLEGGHVRIEARVAKSEVRLSVEDDGPGFAPDSREGAASAICGNDSSRSTGRRGGSSFTRRRAAPG